MVYTKKSPALLIIGLIMLIVLGTICHFLAAAAAKKEVEGSSWGDDIHEGVEKELRPEDWDKDSDK